MDTSNSIDEASKRALLIKPLLVKIREVNVHFNADGMTEIEIVPSHPCIRGELTLNEVGKPILVLIAICPAHVCFDHILMVVKPGPFFQRELWNPTNSVSLQLTAELAP